MPSAALSVQLRSRRNPSHEPGTVSGDHADHLRGSGRCHLPGAKVSEQDAIRLLYASRLYAALEDEQTKLWQYSTPMLCTLLNQELAGQRIAFPDV